MIYFVIDYKTLISYIKILSYSIYNLVSKYTFKSIINVPLFIAIYNCKSHYHIVYQNILSLQY